MPAYRKTIFAAATAAAAIAVAFGGAFGDDAATAGATAAPRLVPCAGFAEGRCGSLRVPLDRTNSASGRVTIAFAFVPRLDKSRPSLGTVVLSSGPILAAATEYTQGLAPIRSRRDVLFVDQRGTGRSGALNCGSLRGVVPALLPRDQLLAKIGSCGRGLGARAALYGTAAAADDIDAVRGALGLKRLDLWGSSYGTYLMTVYAARHPTHVRSLVLHGAYPIDFDPWALDRLAAARRSIRLVCARTRNCRGETVLANVAHLATRLRAHPIAFTVPAGARTMTAQLDEAALASVVYGSGNVAGFGRIPAAAASAVAGDFAPMRRLVELTLQPIDETFGQSFAQQCHEYPRVFSFADSHAARRTAYLDARGAIGPGSLAPFSAEAWTETQLEAVDSCLTWPNDVAAGRPFPLATRMPDVPVLALTGDLDTNTPAPSGREAARKFADARFLEIPNVGHTPETSPCAVAAALQFIATLKVNPRACAGTGTPPPVVARAPRVAAELRVAAGAGTPSQRRAVALVVATAADLTDQAQTLATRSAANGLRGGRYVATPKGVRLDRVRVVRDARVSGIVVPGETGGMKGTVRVTGPGVAAAQLRVSLTANGSARATGSVDGRAVDLRFRF